MTFLLQQIGRRSSSCCIKRAIVIGSSSTVVTNNNTRRQQQRRWIHHDGPYNHNNNSHDHNSTVPASSTSFQQQQQQQRSLSSAAAADELDDDEFEQGEEKSQRQLVVVNHYQQQQQRQQQRPRLHALRQRLKEEKPDLSTIATTARSPTPDSNSNIINSSLMYNQIMNENRTKSVNENSAFENILLDKYGRKHTYLRISLTERCNLRCTYCMPPEGVPLQHSSKLLSTEEILLLTQHFLQAGVTKIRLTGGEPTLRKDIKQVIHGITQLGLHAGSSSTNGQQQQQQIQQLGMTTNAVTLAKHIHDYVDAGLNSINISLDTLDPNKFEALTRRPAKTFYRVYEAIRIANDLIQQQIDNQNHENDPGRKQAKLLKIKVNCVVQQTINEEEIVDFCNLTKEFPHVQIRFIEYMPFTENGWSRTTFLSYRDMIKQNKLDDHKILKPDEIMDPHDTTKWYTYEPTGSKIGFITSMSNHFCAGCNRLRLTADGQIKVCLFDGNSTLSLRDCLRESMAQIQNNNEQQQQQQQQQPIIQQSQSSSMLTNNLNQVIYNALQEKKFALGGHKSPDDISKTTTNRPMTLIGG